MITIGEYKIRVRYKDTDQMGVVYHANYLNYYEEARTELLREKGFSYKFMEEQGVMLPVREVRVKYIAPALYDELLTVKVLFHGFEGGARLRFDNEVYNEQGKLINVGYVELVFMDSRTRRPCHAPDWFKQAF